MLSHFKLKFSLLLLMAFGWNSCVTLNTVSLTQVPKQRGRVVQAEGSRVIFLGLSFDNKFVDGMVDDLKDQCRNGRVTGILTKDEVVNYFLYLVLKRRVVASGYCIKG